MHGPFVMLDLEVNFLESLNPLSRLSFWVFKI